MASKYMTLNKIIKYINSYIKIGPKNTSHALIPKNTFLALIPKNTFLALIPKNTFLALIPKKTSLALISELISIYTHSEINLDSLNSFVAFILELNDFILVDQAPVADHVACVFIEWGINNGYDRLIMLLYYRLYTLYIILPSLFSPYTYNFHKIFGMTSEWYIFNLPSFISSFSMRMRMFYDKFSKNSSAALRLRKLPKSKRFLNSKIVEKWVTNKIIYCAIFFSFSNSIDSFIFNKFEKSKMMVYNKISNELYVELNTHYQKVGYNIGFSKRLFNLTKYFVFSMKKLRKYPLHLAISKEKILFEDIGDNSIFSKSGDIFFIKKKFGIDYSTLSNPVFVDSKPVILNPLLKEEVRRSDLIRVVDIINKMNAQPISYNLKMLNRFVLYASIPSCDVVNLKNPLDTCFRFITFYEDILCEIVKDRKFIYFFDVIREKMVQSGSNVRNSVNYNEYIEALNDQMLVGIVNTYTLNLEIIKEIRGLSKYINFVFDSRFRIYAYQQPVNYQLHHIVRSLILFFRSNKINSSFLLKNILDQEVYSIINHDERSKLKLFIVDNLNNEFCLDLLSKFIKLKPVSVRMQEDLIKFINTRNYYMYYSAFEFFEFFLSILSKLNPVWSSVHEDRISKGYDVLCSIAVYAELISKEPTECDVHESYNIILDLLAKLGTKKRKAFSELGWLINLCKWLVSVDITFHGWFENDASANALQLIALRSFLADEYALEILNIFNNNTGHKDYYSLAVSILKKELMMNESLWLMEAESTKISVINAINRDLTKNILMPGAYGQLENESCKNIKTFFYDRNIDLKKDTLSDLSVFIYKITFKAVRDTNFHLDRQILFTKAVAKMLGVNFLWKSDFGLLVNNNSYKKKRVDSELKKYSVSSNRISKLKNILLIIESNNNTIDFNICMLRDIYIKTNGDICDYVKNEFEWVIKHELPPFESCNEYDLVKYLAVNLRNKFLPANIIDSYIFQITMFKCDTHSTRIKNRIDKALMLLNKSKTFIVDHFANKLCIEKAKYKTRKTVRLGFKCYADELKLIKPLFWIGGNEFDVSSIVSGSSANITHQRDGFIALKTVDLAFKYDIPVLPIHDAFLTAGSNSMLIKILYKSALISSIIMDVEKTAFPYSEADKLTNYIKNLNIIDRKWYDDNNIIELCIDIQKSININKDVYNSKFYLRIFNSINLLS